MFTPARALTIDENQRKRLRFLANSGKTPQKVALRARIVLLASEGVPNNAIAARLGTTRPTVLLWRERFRQRGAPGLLRDAPRPGRKKAIAPVNIIRNPGRCNLINLVRRFRSPCPAAPASMPFRFSSGTFG